MPRYRPAFGHLVALTSTGAPRPLSLADALEVAAPHLHCVRVTRTDHVAQETPRPVADVVDLLRDTRRRPRLRLDDVDGGDVLSCEWPLGREQWAVYEVRSPEAAARHLARQQWPTLEGPRAWVDAAERARSRYAGDAPSSPEVGAHEWLRRHLALLVAGADPLAVLLACGEQPPAHLPTLDATL